MYMRFPLEILVMVYIYSVQSGVSIVEIQLIRVLHKIDLYHPWIYCCTTDFYQLKSSAHILFN